MATRNQVLSMFGMSPDQMIQQEQEQRRQEIAAIQDPYQRSGALIGQQLGGMFGGQQESADVQRQRELFAQLQGVDFQNPEQMRAAASQLQGQFPDRALQLLMLADDMETSAQQRATSAAQAEAAGIKSVPKFIGMTYERSGTDVSGEPTYTPRPLYENVPIPAKDLEAYYAGTGNYKGWLAPTADKAPPSSKEDEGNYIERDPTAVEIPNPEGAPIIRQNDNYYLTTDDGRVLATPLTEDQRRRAKIPETAPPELPMVKEQRQQVEQQIEANRLKQPSTAAQDQLNPFSL